VLLFRRGMNVITLAFSFRPSCGNSVGMLPCPCCTFSSPTPLLRCTSGSVCLTPHSHMEYMCDIVPALHTRHHVYNGTPTLSFFASVSLLQHHTVVLLSPPSTPASRNTCISFCPTSHLRAGACRLNLPLYSAVWTSAVFSFTG